MIGTFDFRCRRCGHTFEFLVLDCTDNRESRCCPLCQTRDIERLFTLPRNHIGNRGAVLMGGFSDDPASDLYIRPDKDLPARELHWTYRRIEQMEKEGKTPHVDDFNMAKERIEMYRQMYGDDL